MLPIGIIEEHVVTLPYMDGPPLYGVFSKYDFSVLMLCVATLCEV